MSETAAFLRRLAAAAAAETLPRFRRIGAIDNKRAGDFDPVTEADRAAERAIRRLIAAERPGDGILGEEFGAENEDAQRVWVIDPIDGTRAFISGLPLWGTLVGLTERGDAVAGMMSQPFTGELFYADEDGRVLRRTGGRRDGLRCAQRGVSRRRRCARPRQRCFRERSGSSTTGSSRWCACRATAPTATPTACSRPAMSTWWSKSGLQPYDIVALVPIIEKAGGVVTSWRGGPAEAGGAILAAATPQLHAAAMELLAG